MVAASASETSGCGACAMGRFPWVPFLTVAVRIATACGLPRYLAGNITAERRPGPGLVVGVAEIAVVPLRQVPAASRRAQTPRPQERPRARPGSASCTSWPPSGAPPPHPQPRACRVQAGLHGRARRIRPPARRCRRIGHGRVGTGGRAHRRRRDGFAGARVEPPDPLGHHDPGWAGSVFTQTSGST